MRMNLMDFLHIPQCNVSGNSRKPAHNAKRQRVLSTFGIIYSAPKNFSIMRCYYQFYIIVWIFGMAWLCRSWCALCVHSPNMHHCRIVGGIVWSASLSSPHIPFGEWTFLNHHHILRSRQTCEFKSTKTHSYSNRNRMGRAVCEATHWLYSPTPLHTDYK